MEGRSSDFLSSNIMTISNVKHIRATLFFPLQIPINSKEKHYITLLYKSNGTDQIYSCNFHQHTYDG